MKKVMIFLILFNLSGCIANTLIENSRGITIKHNGYGEKRAFKMAEEHCSRFDKVSLYRGATQQTGAGGGTSTWECVEK